MIALFRVLAIASLVVILIATISPLDWRAASPLPANYDRALAFLVLGTLFALAFPGRTARLMLLGIVVVVGLEALQLITSDRHARLADAVLKCVAVVAGVGLGALAQRLLVPLAQKR